MRSGLLPPASLSISTLPRGSRIFGFCRGIGWRPSWAIGGASTASVLTSDTESAFGGRQTVHRR